MIKLVQITIYYNYNLYLVFSLPTKIKIGIGIAMIPMKNNQVNILNGIDTSASWNNPEDKNTKNSTTPSLKPKLTNGINMWRKRNLWIAIFHFWKKKINGDSAVLLKYNK